MAIGSVNYSTPINVNGFACRNCTDVELAKKNIDPVHPKSGPNNRDAASDATRVDSDPVKIEAARKAAETKGVQVVGYSPTGPRTAAIDAGSVFSIAA
jgi:hypothetical protein